MVELLTPSFESKSFAPIHLCVESARRPSTAHKKKTIALSLLECKIQKDRKHDFFAKVDCSILHSLH